MFLLSWEHLDVCLYDSIADVKRNVVISCTTNITYEYCEQNGRYLRNFQ